MQIAIQTPPETTSFRQLNDLWQAADRLGFHAAFTFDHFVPLDPNQKPGAAHDVPAGPQLEGWTTLAALAAKTEQLQVGVLVSGVTYRHPVLLAKMAVTLDHITQGRAILGLGAAWHEAEHLMYGFDFAPVGERMGRLEEALELIGRLCREKSVDFDGRWYQLHGAPFDPKPVRSAGLPILVGGSGPRLRGIATRHATMFNSFGAPWEWRDINSDLDRRLELAGRHPGDMMRTAFVFSELSDDKDLETALVANFRRNRGGTDDEVRRRVVVGTPDRMIEVLHSYARAGVEMVVLNVRPDLETRDLERFATEVLPALDRARAD